MSVLNFETNKEFTGIEIAVVGMAGRFPGAKNVDIYWQNLCNEVESLTWLANFDKQDEAKGSWHVPAGFLLSDVDMFDAKFFAMSPKDAAITDPQQRLLLECAWEALENAGYAANCNTQNIGVYVSSGPSSYLINNIVTNSSILNTTSKMQLLIGNDKDYAANRISYKLDLKGPSVVVQSACSSSLLAVHIAVQALLAGECDVALAGGISLEFPMDEGYLFEDGSILSKDGHCKPFSHQSSGTVRGNGGGVVVLKRLEDAINDQDHIYAIIRGSATNNDGAQKVGYAAPSVEGQSRVIQMAHAVANIDPSSIGYIETHGTATTLGDPIEIAALTEAFGPQCATASCKIGSVKSNIGHLDAGAGIAGFIKTALSLHHKFIPATLHYEAPNPAINFANTPFVVASKSEAWSGEMPYRAGVSSFGIGGSNVHIVMEQPPLRKVTNTSQTNTSVLLRISAKSKKAAQEIARQLPSHLRANPHISLADVAYTLNKGRKFFPSRISIVAKSVQDAIEKLETKSIAEMSSGEAIDTSAKLAFMFPGQGTQYAGMAANLYQDGGVFAQEFDELAALFNPLLGLDLREVIFSKDKNNQLSETWLSQPAIFAIEYALAKHWIALGITPEGMIGHSIGEYVAATLASVFTLKDAVHIVATRGRLMQNMARGAMMAVATDETNLRPILPSSISIAAINRPSLVVVSGPSQEITTFRQMLEKDGITCHHIESSHAFHSTMMDPCLAEFESVLTQITLSSPLMPFISNLNGKWITVDEATSPSYWVRHLRETVRFADGLSTLIEKQAFNLLECGPGTSLSQAVRKIALDRKDVNAIALLSSSHDSLTSEEQILRVQGQLWCYGHNLTIPTLQEQGNKIPLPTYCFERTSHWIEANHSHDVHPKKNIEKNHQELVLENTESLPRKTANTITEKLALIWCETLGLDDISFEDNFFDLGGDSILSIQIANKARTIGLHFGPVEILEHPTVNQLINALGGESLPSNTLSESTGDLTQIYDLDISPEDAYKPFPLTDIQHAYWVGRNVANHSGNVAAHAYEEFECYNLNVGRLESALNELVNRHGMLRAIITHDGMQQVLPTVPHYVIAVNDFSQLKSKEAIARLEAFRSSKSHQIMPYNQWPLFDISVTEMPDGTSRLHVSFDLLIMDAWSITLFWKELEERYYNPDYQPDPVAITFRDYVLTELRLEKSPSFQRAQDYWLKRANDLPRAPALPLKLDPRGLENHQFIRRETTIPNSMWNKLKEVSARQGLTPSILLLAAYSEMLATWSETSHFCLNLPAFNRLELHPQVHEVMGDFTSVLLFEVDIREEETFLARAKKMRDRLWNDLSALQYSGIKVLRNISENSTERLTIPYVFTSLLFPSAGDKPIVSRLGKLVKGISQTPHVWLDCQVYEENGNLIINWDAVDGLFDPEMLDNMFMDYRALLMRLSKEEAMWSENQWRDKLAERFNTEAIVNANLTAKIFNESLLHQGFLSSVKTSPDAPAILGDKSFSYAELEKMSAHFAQMLVNDGIASQSRVAVVADKGWEQIVAVLAILRAGYSYVPLDPSLPKERLHNLLEAADIHMAMTTSLIDERIEWPDNFKRICVTNEIGNTHNTWCDPYISSDSLAYIIFTSGTSGQPKGVMITHEAATNTIADINTRFAVSHSDRVLALSSLSFDLSVYDIFGLLACGGAVVIPQNELAKDPAHWVKCIETHQVTIWNSVPALMELLVNSLSLNKNKLNSIRLTMMSGDWINISLPEKMKTALPNAMNVSLGGATEASIWSIFHIIRDIDPMMTSIPYGKALANQRFYVFDDHLRIRPEGVAGELYIGGDGLASGYLNNPTETNTRFINHPRTGERLYKTGDLGRWLPDGSIEFLGRIDNQIKINGFRIETGEIERIACEHTQVEACVVRTHKQGESTILVSYICSKHSAKLDKNNIRLHFAASLPGYMVPSVIIILENFPLSGNGKVDIAQLPLPEITDTNSELALPENEIELRVRQLVNNILGVIKFESSQDLFQLGIDSRRLTELVTNIRIEFTEAFPLSAAFEKPNIHDISLLIEEILTINSGHNALPPIHKLLCTDKKHLSSAQKRLWFHDQLNPGNCTYNLVEPFHFSGSLNVDALSEAFRIFITRHPILTSQILDVNAEPYMKPAQSVTLDIHCLNVNIINSTERKNYLRSSINSESSTPFDTTNGKMFRVRIISFSPQDHVLIVAVHHIVWDGWSTAIMISQIGDIYNQLIHKETPKLKSAEINFFDVANWEQAQQCSPIFNNQLEYWISQLGNNLPVLALPTDSIDVNSISNMGERQHFNLNISIAQSFEQFCSAHGITLFMGYMAAWQTLLHWWCQQDDIVVGTPAGHRVNPKLSNVIGFLVNSLAIRTQLQCQEQFAELCKRVKQTCLDAYSNQDIPFDQIVNALRPKRKISESAPIYRSWFVLHDVQLPSWKLDDLEVTQLDAEFLLDVHDIKLSLVAKDSGIEGGLDYRTALFTPETIKNLSECFILLIEHIAENPTITILDIRKNLEKKWNKENKDTSAFSSELPAWNFSTVRRQFKEL